ncbi:Carboxypeptidase [Fusarium keratoplasticum]|uniref:Carboxypeptidase n=1 Tax=Fusarium keratoplasticum TaxID=1328300 RepID=A0ACC0QFZ0_9HYPO|nr:Carboxypeptidase [Fusarium keratoplasticum]KAI8652245.1 Carboxypeptidase [Fusarium keratoplasticum]KAI8652986.1 Carboxypeptidase [Fusarium keratoplasticum]
MLRLLTWGLVALAAGAQAAIPLAVSPSHLDPGTPFSGRPGVKPFTLRLGHDTASVCNSSTPGTSGFIASKDRLGGKSSIFFWFFESKHDPTSDPVILWMTGGPGASSVGYGHLMELGPCRIAPEGGYTVDNPFGWNANATLLFVDQPVGVGYSRGEHSSQGLHDASTTMDQFLRQFMMAFPDLADRDFYIAGESYGGSWVPALATTILQSQSNTTNDAAPIQVQGEGRGVAPASDDPDSSPRINLKGVMIGNGLIRRSIQNIGFFETVCNGPDSLFNTSQCLQWAPRAMWCEENLGICETDGMKSAVCKEAETRCSAISRVVVEDMHRNPYDFRQECYDPTACYPEMQHIDEYLNRADVKQALGVPKELPFLGISFDVLEQWERVGDLWRASDSYVNYLLKSGIRVLIYVGDKDLYCNSAGMRLLVDRGLSWDGQPFIRFRELMPWYVGTKAVGRWKSYEPLTYAEISDAGHLSPFDKPEEALTLINAWIQGGLPSS